MANDGGNGNDELIDTVFNAVVLLCAMLLAAILFGGGGLIVFSLMGIVVQLL